MGLESGPLPARNSTAWLCPIITVPGMSKLVPLLSPLSSLPDVPPSGQAVRAQVACRELPARPSPPFPERLAGSRSAERTAQDCTPLPRVPQLQDCPERRRRSDPGKLVSLAVPEGYSCLLMAEIPRPLCLSPLSAAPVPRFRSMNSPDTLFSISSPFPPPPPPRDAFKRFLPPSLSGCHSRQTGPPPCPPRRAAPLIAPRTAAGRRLLRQPEERRLSGGAAETESRRQAAAGAYGVF